MKTLIWKGIYYDSIEYFNLKEENNLLIVNATIIGASDQQIFNVDTVPKSISGKKRDNHWEINGINQTIYKDFMYIDISLTPFTNTLPINNLRLTTGQQKTIDVIYINILADYIKPVKQIYTRKSNLRYQYDNVENDFTAEIQIDDLGLVEFYPQLFKKIAEK